MLHRLKSLKTLHTPFRALSSTASTGSQIVSAWTEFDPLEEVIVGIADGSTVPPDEPGHRSKVWHLGNTIADMNSPRCPKKVATASAELDNLAQVLEQRGIVVRRPTAVPNVPVVAPSFEMERMNGWSCPRDTLLVVGEEIFEAPLSWRSRVFEKFAYRDILSDYHARDPSFLWSSAPHPELKDSLFRVDYHPEDMTMDSRLQQMEQKEFVTTDGGEPVFDAADAIRVGKDVFVLHSQTCNVLGFEWLERQLRRRGVRSHLVHMPTVHNPSHIDASVLPLRPPCASTGEKGVVLVAPPVADCEMVHMFEKNNWEVLLCPEPDVDPVADPTYKGKSGKWISLNILSLDHNTVVVADHDVSLIRALEAKGFECVTVPFQNVIEFGGGLHCCTLDVRRSGDACVDYFPSFSE
jgi:glycine amidinotransferase